MGVEGTRLHRGGPICVVAPDPSLGSSPPLYPVGKVIDPVFLDASHHQLAAQGFVIGDHRCPHGAIASEIHPVT